MSPDVRAYVFVERGTWPFGHENQIKKLALTTAVNLTRKNLERGLAALNAWTLTSGLRPSSG